MKAVLARFFGGRFFGQGRPPGAVDFYAAVLAQARAPAFYRDLAVPDTLDGRFDLLVLHVILVMHRLKGQGTEAEEWSRTLYETMITDFDRSLREMGVGDTGIARRVKTMVRGAHGRLLAYDAALAAEDDSALEVALDNNVYGTVRDVPPEALRAMAAYVRRLVAALAAQPVADLLAGRIRFVAPAANADHERPDHQG